MALYLLINKHICTYGTISIYKPYIYICTYGSKSTCKSYIYMHLWY